MSDEDDGDEVALGGDDAAEPTGLPPDTGTVEVIERRSHPVSAKTRELMKAAVDKLKAEREPGEGGDEYEPAIESPADPAPADPAPAAAPAAAAPAPDADRERQWQERETQHAEREKALAERERAADLSVFAETWIDKGPIDALKELLKSRGIASTDDEWKDEAAELITDLTEKVFGSKVDPSMRNAVDARRAKKANTLTRRMLAERDAEMARQQTEAQANAQWNSARDALGRELGKEEHRSNYSFLAALDNPAQVVMEYVQQQAKEGKSLTWQEAAKAANDYIHDQVAQHDKRWRPLLEKVSKPKAAAPTAPGRPPGTSQVTPPKPPPQAPAAPPPKKSERYSNETHRQETKRKMRAAFRQGQ